MIDADGVDRRPVPRSATEQRALITQGFRPASCGDCGAEFWCSDPWEVFCAPCAAAPGRQNIPPRDDPLPETHAQRMRAGYFYDQQRRQQRARVA